MPERPYYQAITLRKQKLMTSQNAHDSTGSATDSPLGSMIRTGKESDAKKKLLAINFGGIGDEILFFPTLQTIHEYCPEWSITLLVEPRSKSAVELTNLVDHVITFDIKKRPLAVADLIELLAIIKDGGYDCIVSSGSSPMVSALLFLSGVRERVGYGSNTLSTLLLTQPVPLNRKQYAACMYHDLALGFLKEQGIPPRAILPESLVPKVILKDDAMERMSRFLERQGLERAKRSSNSKLILMHPGTSKLATQKGIIKHWPTDAWIDLLFLIAGENEKRPEAERDIVILAGGPDDKEIISDILMKAGDQIPHLVSAYGETRNLSDLAALIQLCDQMVCVDSAPMHVAVGLRKPLVALFGPFDPKLLLPNDRIFRYLWDSRGGSRTMLDGLGVNIPPADVFKALMELEKSPLPAHG